MATTSRRLSAKCKTAKPSHTPGREKGGNCVKTALKTFGATANPYKLKGYGLRLFDAYTDEVYRLNGQKRPYPTGAA